MPLFILTALPMLLGAWLLVRTILAQCARAGAETFCNSPFCDYGLFWVAGTLRARGLGAAVYDYPRYQALGVGLVPGSHGFLPFEYPPMMLLPDRLIGALPFVAGYYLFTLVTLAAVLALLRLAGLRWWCIALGLLSPAAMWEIYLGQFGLLCGAVLLAGLALSARRPAAAGGLLGLLCVKPHYALLVPVAVLAARRWRAVAAGAAVVCVLIIAACGGGVWPAYWGPGAAEIRTVMTAPFGAGASDGGTSVYWMLRSLHASAGGALAGQLLVSAVIAAWVWRQWQSGAGRADVTVLATFLVSPYGYIDDLAIMSVILPTLLRRGCPWANAALAWLWVLPAYLAKFTIATGLLITPLAVVLALVIASQVVPRGGDAPVRYALRNKNSPCSPNKFASAADRRQGVRAPASSAANQSSTR
jgi:alpha-1,2-mannosyltransferase